jgi:hypothetical protein
VILGVILGAILGRFSRSEKLAGYRDTQAKEEEGRGPEGQAEAGTIWFHAYATAYTILLGRKVTIALAFVKNSDGKLDVLDEGHPPRQGSGHRVQVPLSGPGVLH